ncbi:MAG: hypothetical protein WAK45_08265 [Methanoregula sp.]
MDAPAVPKAMLVAPVKPVPVTVTAVPPPGRPREGETTDTCGAAASIMACRCPMMFVPGQSESPPQAAPPSECPMMPVP